MEKPRQSTATETISSLVDPRNARSEEYQKTLHEIVKANECPLCPPMEWHPNPILQDDGKWIITPTSQPYENTTHHLLIVPKRHIIRLSELLPPDFQSILDLSNWATQEFGIKGGGLTMRFGETLYSGATLQHIHAHLIVPTVELNGQVKHVDFPIG